MQLPHPDLHSLSERLAQVEQRLDRARFTPSTPPGATNTLQIAKVAEAVLTAMDGRFGELEAEGERRLAEVEARIKLELEGLDGRARAEAQMVQAGTENRVAAPRAELTGALEAQRVRAESDFRVLRSQMLQVHKEFAETLARLVDEQIENTISLRLQAIQEQMRDGVREESQSVCATFGKEMESWVDARWNLFREETGGLGREIADLHARLDSDERNLFETVQAIGQSCMQAADRIAVPGAPPAAPLSNGGSGGSSETHITVENDLPGFARQGPSKRSWRIPAVSGFLLATTGLVALHYFAA
jgi:hypothetical protein